MDLNANFAERVVVHSDQIDWQASPMPSVERRMLDRIGDEVARATTIVRYAPGSEFSEHTHTGGEEFIVLEGVFSDEHGDFPAGSYIRNPPTTAHTPGSRPGCTIFVKLWQFALKFGNRIQWLKWTCLMVVKSLFLRVVFSEKDASLVKGSWLRLPVGSQLRAVVSGEGAEVWMKLGHVPFAKPPAV